MLVQYRPGKSAYEATLFKYEHRKDHDAYNKAMEEWRAARESGQSAIAPYPKRNAFDYVIEYNITGDSLTFLSAKYPTVEKSIPSAYTGRRLDDAEVCDIVLTPGNHDINTRYVQAKAFKAAGYHGPIGGGEARGLRNLFNEIELPDLVRRGYFLVRRTVLRQPSKYSIKKANWSNQPAPQSRRVMVDMLQYCYVFKSPIPSVPFDKFVKLARMYKSGKGGLRQAVVAVMANPEAHKEVDTIEAIDILSKMVGMDG